MNMHGFHSMKKSILRAGFLLILPGLLASLLLAPAAAASPFQDYANTLSSWNVMQGYSNGDFRLDDPVSRAQFVAMVNRAYGYTRQGPTPFRDVPPGAWYADDISIAYNAGYFSGTSANTASPNAYLTREQALVLLARGMRLESVPGEVTRFNDGSQFSSFSKGYVNAAVNMGLISGYDDGTFRPQRRITRGQMAKILANALGTLVYESGTHTLGEVFGNVTINAPGATLKDTTVAGNLYISGGLDLGAVNLDNVRVLGDIIVAGGGESESGENSVVLRNVEANNLLVDSLAGQYVSLLAEGDTLVNNANIRSSAFIEDRTKAETGLLNITLDDTDGNSQFTLSGNLKNIVNKAPNSSLNISQGTAQSLTMDEKAVGSRLNIDTNTSVKELNLDVGAAVTGPGDVGNLHVNANGTTSTMLPDTIEIRPGLTAGIAGENMDTKLGEESSADPRLLAGYPRATNVAPTSASVVFAGNKKATVYWAVSALTDGSIEEDELITPSAYGSKAVKSGNLQLAASNQEISAPVTGLTAGGSYYLSAIMVDARGTRSPLKVASFSTPDNTVPNFAAGYPTMSRVRSESAQAAVMATKSCNLYYALLPKNAAAPTTADFKAGFIPGNKGFGVESVIKNIPVYVNFSDLAELEPYDLYLWLCDADGVKSSAVKKISFTTIDGTPPRFRTRPIVISEKANSLGLTCSLDENCTLFWVAVNEGTEYPKEPANGSNLTVDYARLEISSGMGNPLKSGKANARADTDVNFTVSGLKPESRYDIYYVARDPAGNYSDMVLADKTTYMVSGNTLDTVAPTVVQEFTRYSGTNTASPFADTDIRLIFSENVHQASTNSASYYELYQDVVNAASDTEREERKEAFAKVLRATIRLKNATGDILPQDVEERTANYAPASWVIDYRNARASLDVEGKLTILLPTTGDTQDDPSALKLSSGSTYFFEFSDIADISTSQNLMGVTNLPRFTTISAQAALRALNITELDDGTPIDMAFSMTPVSTSKVEDTIDWDMLLWSDTTVRYDVYVKEPGGARWQKISLPGGGSGGDIRVSAGSQSDFLGQSLQRHLYGLSENPRLNTLRDGEEDVYQYAIHLTSVEGVDEGPSGAGRQTWSQQVNFRANVLTGSSVSLGNLAATELRESDYRNALSEGITDISVPEDFSLRKQFRDTAPPTFRDGYPTFAPTDMGVEMTLLVSRPNTTVYYVIAPVGSITTTPLDGTKTILNADGTVSSDVPREGSDAMVGMEYVPFELNSPATISVTSPKYSDVRIKTGSVTCGDGTVPMSVGGLQPSTDYFAYFVLKGTGQTYSDYTQLFTFQTPEVTRPVITLRLSNPSVYVQSNLTSEVYYALIPYNSSMDAAFREPFKNVMKAEGDLSTEELSQLENLKLVHPEVTSTMTVLEAMATNVPKGTGSAGSVFDVFAQNYYKDLMAQTIRNADGRPNSPVVGNGSLDLNANRESEVDCSNMPMSTTTQYALVAVGRSTMGSGDAFRATYPITLEEDTPPLVTEVLPTLEVTKNGTISGSVTLIFDRPLYFLDKSVSPWNLRQVDNGGLTSDTSDTGGSGRNTARFASVLEMVSGTTPSTVNIVTSKNSVNRETNSIAINYTGTPRNTNILFSGISSSNSVTKEQVLAVTVKVIQVPVTDPATGNVTYTSEADVQISAVWDGR